MCGREGHKLTALTEWNTFNGMLFAVAAVHHGDLLTVPTAFHHGDLLVVPTAFHHGELPHKVLSCRVIPG